MPIQVPAVVETRHRRRMSRRAKRIGYAVFTGYLLALAAVLYFRSGTWAYFVWTSGFALGLRYLRAGRLLEQSADAALTDEATQKLITEYEEKIRIEGQREVAHGTLSMPGAASAGELSVAKETGALSYDEET